MKRIAEGFRQANRQLEEIASLGVENNRLGDKICAWLLAVTPLLQHYKGVYVEAAVCVLVLCLPWIGLRLLFALPRLRHELRKVLVVLPILLFQLYRVIDHGTTLLEMAHGATLVVYFLAAAAGCINLVWFIRSTFCVAMAAGVGIIAQYICWYGFGFHLQLVATDLLLTESEAWVALAQTGTISVNGVYMGFYRPSAFFLEPSHMFLYLMPHLFLLLLAPNINLFRRICAAVLSLSLLFSTSGMGIAVVAGVWLLQLGFTSGSDNRLQIRNLFRVRNIVHCVLFVVVFFGLCLSVPALQSSILRIFLSKEAAERVQQAIGDGMISGVIDGQIIDGVVVQKDPSAIGTTAITARTTRGFSLLKKMQGMELLVGLADSMEGFTFNKSGFVATTYKYGLIGLILTYFLYLYSAAFLKAPHRWLSIILLGVSFFSAHTHGTFYMMYYYFVLLDGCSKRTARRERLPVGGL